MALFIFGIIFMLGALIAVGVGAAMSDSTDRFPLLTGSGIGAVVGIGGLLMLIFSMTASIGTRDIGVLTTFGKPSGHLEAGLHWKSPWAKVTTLDGAVQTDNFTSAGGDANDCITVRIAHQATSCVDASIRWQIKPEAADPLFQNYRKFDHIRDSLVTRELRSALNDNMENYDVLAVDQNGNSSAPPLSDVATKVTAQMQAEIGTQISVLSIFLPVQHLDDSTQSRLNALLAQIGQTRIAQQAEQTAQAQADANKILAQSVSHDPNVLVSKCYDLLNELANKGQAIPAGFSCWPGGSNASVLVNGSAAPAK